MLVSNIESFTSRPRFSDAYKASPQPKDELLVRKEKLIDKLAEVIASLPREARENLEFFSGQIIDRSNRRDDTLTQETNILKYFPNAGQLDLRVFSILEPLFQEVALITKTEYVVPTFNTPDFQEEAEVGMLLEEVGPKSELAELEATPTISHEAVNRVVKASIAINTTNRRKVAKIKQAPQELLNNVYPKAIVETELVPVSEESGLSVFSTDSSANIDNLMNISSEDSMKALPEIDEFPSEVVISQINEPENFAPKVEPLVAEEEQVTFEMLPGMSLADLALAVCEDVNGWIDIYEANRDLIERVIIQQNYTNFGELEIDKNIFTGLNLVIPMIFKKEPVKEAELAA